MIHLSVIIPTINRSRLLTQTLESITKQTFDKDCFEVIVVDNGSTDDTQEVVDSFKGLLPNLRCIYDERPGLHTGRHVGYQNAQSDILVYADDDIIAFPTWIEGIWESFQDESVVLVGGKDLPKYEAPVPFWILEKWYKMSPEGHAMPELSLIDLGGEIKEITPYYVYGCNYSVRKKIIDETYGFHPDGMPFELIQYRGDGEWYVNRYIDSKGYKVIYNPKASVYHYVTKERLTLDYFKKRAFCSGVELGFCSIKYRDSKKSTNSISGIIKKILIHKKVFKKFKMMIQTVVCLFRQTDLEREIEKSRKIGYEYQQWMYKNDRCVHDWLEKTNYIE